MRRERVLGYARVTCLVLIPVAVVVLATGCGRLDKDSVSTELGTLQSATAEGMLVAREAARSRAPADFIEIRTAELSKQATDASETLTETPTESGLQRAADRGAEIGDRASALLDSLHSDPGNSDLATNVTEQLRDLSDEAESVDGSL